MRLAVDRVMNADGLCFPCQWRERASFRPEIANRRSHAGRVNAMASTLLRIVILHEEPGIWCAFCAAASAVAVTYVVEAGTVATGVHTLTSCDTCEPR